MDEFDVEIVKILGNFIPSVCGGCAVCCNEEILPNDVFFSGGYEVLRVGNSESSYSNTLNVDDVYRYSVESQTFELLTKMDGEKISGCGSSLLKIGDDNFLCVFGGETDLCQHGMKLQMYNFSTKKWKKYQHPEGTKGINGFWYSQIIYREINGLPYILIYGDFNSSQSDEWGTKFFLFDLTKKKWIEFDDIGLTDPIRIKCEQDVHFSAGCYFRDSIFVLLGPRPVMANSESPVIPTTKTVMKRFDFDTYEWEDFETTGSQPITTGGSLHSYFNRFLVFWGGYAVGDDGVDLKNEQLKSAIVYFLDIETREWKSCIVKSSEIDIHRNSRSVFVSGNYLYVYGGETLEDLFRERRQQQQQQQGEEQNNDDDDDITKGYFDMFRVDLKRIVGSDVVLEKEEMIERIGFLRETIEMSDEMKKFRVCVNVNEKMICMYRSFFCV